MKRKDSSQNENSTGARPAAQLKQTAINSQPSRDEVARRAYAIYLDQGSPQGLAVQHWLEAEAQVVSARNAGRGCA